jgi:hypothetical protein
MLFWMCFATTIFHLVIALAFLIEILIPMIFLGWFGMIPGAKLIRVTCFINAGLYFAVIIVRIVIAALVPYTMVIVFTILFMLYDIATIVLSFVFAAKIKTFNDIALEAAKSKYTICCCDCK